MKAFVTGATGFIGSHVTAALLRSGYDVRALVRPGRPTRDLEARNVEIVRGDLGDAAALEDALAGCDALFHVAAHYALWTPDPRPVWDTNVGGTRNLLDAAQATGIRKVVYTSTESTVGIARDGQMGTEAGVADPAQLAGHYKRSKFAAERLALERAGQGLPLVVVNPTTPVGAGDVRPTPTGQIVVDYLAGRMPAYVDTGLNIVAVEDVARGHVLALEKGRPGERYILGNRNVTLRELLHILAGVTGKAAPKVRIPLWLALGAAYVDEALARTVTHRPPRIPVVGVQVARHHRYFDCSRAIGELGLPQTPIEEALAQAVRWFTENGYA